VPVVLGTLLNALNSSMIAVALVAIGHAFHAGSEVVWLVSGLYLTAAVAQPTMGRLTDLLGPRRIFCLGLVIVGVSAVGASFAPGLGWLIAARVVMGVGTSAAYPSGLAMIRAWMRDHGAEGTPTGALGAISVTAQSAVALGPPVGGVLVQLAGWRSIFWANIPFVVASLTLTMLWLPSGRPARRRRLREAVGELDVPGVALFVGLLVCLLLFLLSLDRHPEWPVLGGVAVFSAALWWRERRLADPFLDVRMLAENRPLATTYGRTAVTYVVFYSVFYGLPQWLEQGRGLSTAASGLVMLPLAGLGALTTLLAARLANRRGVRPLLVFGSAALLAGSLALLAVGPGTAVAVLVAIAALLGVPNGFNSLGNQTALYEAASGERMGTASGLYRTFQYVGANVASAVVGLTVGAAAAGAGLHEMAVVISVVSAGLLVTASTSRHLRRGPVPAVTRP